MAFSKITLAMTLAVIGLVSSYPNLSFTSLETLLSMDSTFTITTLQGNTVPIYRKGLPPSYVAYWQVIINDKDFVLISAGPKTGDNRMIHEGPKPTFTALLDEEAGGRCVRYFMLSPDGSLMCEDAEGKVVATTVSDLIVEDARQASFRRTNASDPGSGTFIQPPAVPRNIKLPMNNKQSQVDSLVRAGFKDTEKAFGDRAKDVRESFEWIGIEDEPMLKSVAEVIDVGETVKLPVMAGARIVAEGGSSQTDVCAATDICEGGVGTSVRRDAVRLTSYGVKYVAITIKHIDKALVKSVSFRVVIIRKNNVDVKRRYFANQARRRSKRSPYNWSGKSIPHENPCFPEYKQQKYGRCQVGCGPVAWASVFGYLDRRSHDYPSTHGTASQNLYRSGSDGTSGSASQKAPYSVDARMRRYIRRMHDILGTFCFFGSGATRAGRMGRVKSFYTSRVPGGKLYLYHQGFWTLFAGYRSRFRTYAINLIKKGFPAIIGWKVGGGFFKIFRQHYPIATRYRTRLRKVKVCKKFLWWKWSCKIVTVRDWQFYLHMGWGGGYKNGWKKAEAFMTAGVTY